MPIAPMGTDAPSIPTRPTNDSAIPGESERLHMSLKFQILKWGGAGIAFSATLLAAGCSGVPCIHGKQACGGSCLPAVDPAHPGTIDSSEPKTHFITAESS